MKSKYEYRVVYNKDNSTYKLYLIRSFKNKINYITNPVLEHTDTKNGLKKYIEELLSAFDKPVLDIDDIFTEIDKNKHN